MLNTSGVIHALSLNGDGSGEQISGRDISKAIANDALAWVHLDISDPFSRDWIVSSITYLDQIIIDALLADETRPRMLEFDQGTLFNSTGR